MTCCLLLGSCLKGFPVPGFLLSRVSGGGSTEVFLLEDCVACTDEVPAMSVRRRMRGLKYIFFLMVWGLFFFHRLDHLPPQTKTSNLIGGFTPCPPAERCAGTVWPIAHGRYENQLPASSVTKNVRFRPLMQRPVVFRREQNTRP